MFRKVGKCQFCSDPIYDHQTKVVVEKKKYHIGCSNIKEKLNANLESQKVTH